MRVRLSEDELDVIEGAARRSGLSVGAWLRQTAVRFAGEAVEPQPANWRELVAELVRLRTEVVRGRKVPVVELGPVPEDGV